MSTERIAFYHSGGLMFTDNPTHYVEGWYVAEGRVIWPLMFSPDYETQRHLTPPEQPNEVTA